MARRPKTKTLTLSRKVPASAAAKAADRARKLGWTVKVSSSARKGKRKSQGLSFG